MKNNLRELEPNNGRKSFYGKALIETKSNGSEVLLSYNTPIIERTAKGDLIPLAVENVLSNTTCTHLKSFCGLNKAEYRKLLYKTDIKREPAFLETGKQYIDLGYKLRKESIEYLQKVVEEKGIINFESLDIHCGVTYDGGNHPEYASNACRDVIDIHLDPWGHIELNIEEEDEYATDRVFDDGEIYGLAHEIYEALKR